MLTRKGIQYKQVTLFRLHVFKEGSPHLVKDCTQFFGFLSMCLLNCSGSLWFPNTSCYCSVFAKNILYQRDGKKFFFVCLLKLCGKEMPTVIKWHREISVNVITLSYLVQQLENIFHQAVERQWFILSKMVNITFWLKLEEPVLWGSLSSARADVKALLRRWIISDWSDSLSPVQGSYDNICLAVSVGLFQSQQCLIISNYTCKQYFSPGNADTSRLYFPFLWYSLLTCNFQNYGHRKVPE